MFRVPSYKFQVPILHTSSYPKNSKKVKKCHKKRKNIYILVNLKKMFEKNAFLKNMHLFSKIHTHTHTQIHTHTHKNTKM